MSISGAGTAWLSQNDLGIRVGDGSGAGGTLSITSGGLVNSAGGIIVAKDGGNGALNLSAGHIITGSAGVLVGHSRLVIDSEDQGPSVGYLGVGGATSSIIDSVSIGSAGGAG